MLSERVRGALELTPLPVAPPWLAEFLSRRVSTGCPLLGYLLAIAEECEVCWIGYVHEDEGKVVGEINWNNNVTGTD